MICISEKPPENIFSIAVPQKLLKKSSTFGRTLIGLLSIKKIRREFSIQRKHLMELLYIIDFRGSFLYRRSQNAIHSRAQVP